MVTVDPKSLLRHLNDYCTQTLQNGAGLCMARTHYEVTVEHLMLKLMEDQKSDISLLMAAFDISADLAGKQINASLEGFKTGNSGRPVFSPKLFELFQDAWMLSSIELGEQKIRSGAMLLAMAEKPFSYLAGDLSSLLKRISTGEITKGFYTLTQDSRETQKAPAMGATPAGQRETKGQGFLEKYCNNFTQAAEQGKIDPVFGRDEEIRQIISVLARRRKNNPICLGEPGVGKTAVVEGIALKIIEDDVPEVLKNVTLLELDMGLLEAGAGMKGEFENRLKGVIDEIRSAESNTILFIDEAHTLIGAGGAAGGSDAANLLKPALARGELRTIAATTWSEYKKYFEKDPALSRRFQPIKLAPPDVAVTQVILRGLKAGYEASHGVIITDNAVMAAAELSDRYITGRFLPDKAIDLLDTACARVKINLSSIPPALEDTLRKIQALERTKNALERDRSHHVPVDNETLGRITSEIAETQALAEKIREAWTAQKTAAHKVIDLRQALADTSDGAELDGIKKQLTQARAGLAQIQENDVLIQIEVNADLVAQVISDWTGIPLGRMLQDEARKILDLESHLAKRVKGQDDALGAIAEVVRASKAGIKRPDQPMGVFLLVGPSGTGKTETGLALADILFGSEKNSVIINMSEFQERHTVSRLIGSPPGYVGYGEGGILTEAVRRKPYCVVLLDEVEKAHPEVSNLFYQVFDKGILTDGEGKEISFKNTVIILTSNLAADDIHTLGQSDPAPSPEEITAMVRPQLAAYFKPALLARMHVLPFLHLPGDVLFEIVGLKLEKIRRLLLSNNKLGFSWSPDAARQVADRCKQTDTGARNIDYIIDMNILPKISKMILTQMAAEEPVSKISLDLDGEDNFLIEFS